jgi:hypothetical protein
VAAQPKEKQLNFIKIFDRSRPQRRQSAQNPNTGLRKTSHRACIIPCFVLPKKRTSRKKGPSSPGDAGFGRIREFQRQRTFLKTALRSA